MRPGGAREVVVNAIPFAATDHENVRRYVQEVDRAFLPRPQAANPAIAVGNRHPEISLPAAFEAFGAISRRLGVNMASTVQLSATREMATEAAIERRDGEDPTAPGHTRVSIHHLYHAGLWAAIRAGWREGYTAEADHLIVSGNTAEEINASIDAAKEAIDAAAGFTKFTVDTRGYFRTRQTCGPQSPGMLARSTRFSPRRWRPRTQAGWRRSLRRHRHWEPHLLLRARNDPAAGGEVRAELVAQ
jgi:hypothetical protein